MTDDLPIILRVDLQRPVAALIVLLRQIIRRPLGAALDRRGTTPLMNQAATVVVRERHVVEAHFPKRVGKSPTYLTSPDIKSK
jgi:hypothetical protein